MANKFTHPLSGMLSSCLANYGSGDTPRLNPQLRGKVIADSIRIAIDHLEADAVSTIKLKGFEDG